MVSERSQYYILVDRKAVAVSLIEWSRAFEVEDRNVAKSTAVFNGVNVGVSTVFLGLNHQYGDGPPLLFETMIFGGLLDQYQERCSTWEEADKMHEVACQAVLDAYGKLLTAPVKFIGVNE